MHTTMEWEERNGLLLALRSRLRLTLLGSAIEVICEVVNVMEGHRVAAENEVGSSKA